MPRVYRTLAEIPSPAQPSAVTIGNFDGVHIAHQRIIKRIVEVARTESLVPSVLTFHPHPTKIVSPGRAPRLMSTPEQRCEWMHQLGIEQVFILPFDEEFSKLSAEDFIRKIVVGKLNAKAVMVGENFRFGNRQAGDINLLRELGRKYGFTVEIIEGVTLRGHIVSSSGVRKLLDHGEVTQAARYLGRPYSIEGRIVRGAGVGSKKTVPTLNLATSAEIIPLDGVYVTRTYDHSCERQWPSITNVGFRPTFGGDTLTIETYLLAPLDGETPDRIRLEFYHRLRDEKKFESPEALKAQIMKDVAKAQQFHRLLDRVRHDK